MAIKSGVVVDSIVHHSYKVSGVVGDSHILAIESLTPFPHYGYKSWL